MKGHKAIYDTSGVESGFWNVSCECGWTSNSRFNTRKTDAKRSHDGHLYSVNPAHFDRLEKRRELRKLARREELRRRFLG